MRGNQNKKLLLGYFDIILCSNVHFSDRTVAKTLLNFKGKCKNDTAISAKMSKYLLLKSVLENQEELVLFITTSIFF